MNVAWWQQWTSRFFSVKTGELPRLRPRRRSLPSPAVQFLVLETRDLLAGFTPGNLVVNTVGTGATLDGTATAMTLREYGLDNFDAPTTATWVNSFAAPSSGATNNSGNLTDSGSAASHGGLNLSPDGTRISLMGFDAPVGLANVVATTSANNNRVVGTITADAQLTMDRYSDAFSASGIRAAVSSSSTTHWIAGAASGTTNGVRYGSAGTSTLVTNIAPRFVTIATDAVGTQFLVGTTVGSVIAWTSPIPLPTTGVAPQTVALSPIGNDLAEVVILDRSPTVGAPSLGGLDTIYVTNGQATATNGTIAKYEWTGTAWTQRGSATFATSGLNGLAARVLPLGSVQLFATTRVVTAGNNQLLTRLDTAAFGSSMSSGSFTTLASAGTGIAFRGIAFSPDEVTESSLSLNVSGTVNRDGAPVALFNSVTYGNGSSFKGGSLEISGGQFGDALSISNLVGQITTSGTDVLYNGVVIGTISGGSGTSPLRVDFNPRNSTNDVSDIMVKQLLKQLQMATTTTDSSRNLTITLRQAANHLAVTDTSTANVTIPINQPPTAIQFLSSVTSLAEDTNTTAPIRLADLSVIDDSSGTNSITLSGSDAADFEITNNKLWLKAGTSLNFESKASYSVTLAVDDPTVGSNPDVTSTFTLTITDVNEPPTAIALSNTTTSISEQTLTTARKVADITVTDDALGTTALTLRGADATKFALIGMELFLKAGTVLDYETQSTYTVLIDADDATLGSNPDATTTFQLQILDVVEAPPVLFVDDGDANYSQTGAWLTHWEGVGGNLRYGDGTGSLKTARWTFTGLAAGRYQLDGTWLPHVNRANNATYVLRDGTGAILDTIVINQRLTPSGATSVGSRPFSTLGWVTVPGDTLTVELSSAGANGYLIVDALRIQLSPPVPDTPRLEVRTGSTVLTSQSQWGWAAVGQGTVATQTLTVTNTGTADVVLQPAAVTGFTLVGPNFTAGQVLAPGASLTLQVSVSTVTLGSRSGTLSFGHSAGGPYSVSLATTVEPVGVVLIDDGDAGYSQTGAWLTYGEGVGGNLRYGDGTGSLKTARWTFSGLAAGRYQLDGTWLPHVNRANNATYVLRDGTGAILDTFVINQRLTPSGATSVGSRPFSTLGWVTVPGDTLTVELSSAGANGYLIVDALRIQLSPPVPDTPRLEVRTGSTVLTSQSQWDWAAVGQGTVATQTLTITNTGTADVVLQPAAVTGFTLVGPNFTAGQVLAPGASLTLQVSVSTVTLGSRSGTLSFGHSAGGPYSVSLVTTVEPVGVVLVDDGDANYSQTGAWLTYGEGVGGNLRYGDGTGSLKTARWTFSGLAAGRYQLDGTWLPHVNRANNATYVLRDGTGAILDTIVINQRLTPSGATSVGSRPFSTLGWVTVPGDTLTVELSSAGANGYLIVDALRIQLSPPVPDTPRLEVRTGSTVLTSQSQWGWAAVGQGTVATQTLTITNTGTADVVLQPAAVTGFTLVGANFTAGQVLAPGASLTLQVSVSTVTLGSRSGTLSFGHSAGGPYSVSLVTTVEPVGVVLVDDGDANYSQTGAWLTYGEGVGGNLRYGDGTGSLKTARWTFTGLTAGRYQLDGTWLPHVNRATNATYVLRDGTGAILDTFVINQRLTPSGATSVGSRPFSTLGWVTVPGDTLTVELSNAGVNGYVIVDAMRIQRYFDV